MIAPGFVASGVHCGIKADGGLDLALIATADGRPVPAAAVFTTNLAPAGPVQVSRAHLDATGGYAAAVVVNSGNANAATGRTGYEQAKRTCALVAQGLGCRTEEVLVCSTGLIGIPFPMVAVESGVGALLDARRPDGADDAARALLTTDLGPKQVYRSGDGFTLAGMAKGAAMLAPDMATMLAVLTTDAAAAPAELAAALRVGVADSFNALSVDGATSTNDTVIALAGGADAAPWVEFPSRLSDACAELATMMADGAEGATKRARIRVTGAASVDDAARAARKVAESQLVQCSLYGADPYWGRIVSELGSAGVAFDPDLVSIAYGGIVVCREGVAWGDGQARAKKHLQGREVGVTADLGLGDAEAVVTTTDLTPEYIAENMRTS